jgi:ribulose-phosphate 3-epimerase
MRIKIAPSLLSADFGRLEEEVREVERGGADLLHWDVMDGHFVPNLTVGPSVIRSLRKRTDLPFNVHLMIETPEKYLRRFVEAGGNILTVHVETCRNLRGTLSSLRRMGVKVGVALNPETPLRSVEGVMGELDLLLVMTVHPGFGNQRFLKGTLPKLRRAGRRVKEEGLSLDLGVDGGISVETVPEVVRAGANLLVAGTAIYGERDRVGAIRRLRETALASLPGITSSPSSGGRTPGIGRRSSPPRAGRDSPGVPSSSSGT